MLYVEIGILAVIRTCKLELEKILSYLKRYIRDNIKALGGLPKTRDEAIKAFVEMGEDAFEPLFLALKDSDYRIVRGAALALKELGDWRATQPRHSPTTAKVIN